MSASGLLVRFAGLYIALLGGIAAIFYLLDLKGNSGANAGALMGSVVGACMWFANKNKRYLEPGEKRSAFLGMWIIDTALQSIVALGASAAAGALLPIESLLFAIGFVGLLHGAAIYFMVGFAGKQYAKQASKSRR